MNRNRPHTRLLAPLALAAAILSGCGGQSSQVDAFVPSKLLAFGDETSVLTSDGKKYSVNSWNTTTNALDCTLAPLWIQSVANLYSFTFQQCNPKSVTEFKAKTLATVNADVDAVIAQIDAYEASNAFTDTDLVTVMVGVHDVQNAYKQYPAKSKDELVTLLKTKGEALANRINALTAKGPRVLVSTAMDLSVSPYGLAEKAANTDTDRAKLLLDLTDAFNLAMRLKLINDGSKIGLLLGDDLGRGMVAQPSYYGQSNATVISCAVALPDCTSSTMVSGASATTYLWADSTRPGLTYHFYLGEQARSRLASLPF